MLSLAAIAAVVLAAPQPAPAPCPGLAGLEVGQSRTFSFERMAKLDPEKATVTRDVRVTHRPSGRPWVVTVVYDSNAADAKITALYYVVDPPSGVGAALRERYGSGAPVPTDRTQESWDIESCGVRLRYRSRLNEKVQPIEEIWVSRLASAAGAPAVRLETPSETATYFAQKRDLYRRTNADLALQGGSSNEDRARVLLVELAVSQMDDLERLCRYIEAKEKRPVPVTYFGDRMEELIEKREEKMLHHGTYLEQTRVYLKEAQSLSDVIESETRLLYAKQQQTR